MSQFFNNLQLVMKLTRIPVCIDDIVNADYMKKAIIWKNKFFLLATSKAYFEQWFPTAKFH